MSLSTPASSFALWIISSSGQEVLPQPSLMTMRTQWPAASHSHNSPVPCNAGVLSSLWLLPSGLFSALFCFKGSCSASLPPRVSHCRVAWQPALVQGHCWKHMPRGRGLAEVTQRSAVVSTHSSVWVYVVSPPWDSREGKQHPHVNSKAAAHAAIGRNNFWLSIIPDPVSAVLSGWSPVMWRLCSKPCSASKTSWVIRTLGNLNQTMEAVR